MDAYVADGHDEARRGLWRSAAESFASASRAAPHAPALVLAEAICRLNLGDAERAVVLLETAPALREAGAWSERAAWLRAAARIACGDTLGAEEAARDLPRPLWLRVVAHARLAEGDYAIGVGALVEAFRPSAHAARSR